MQKGTKSKWLTTLAFSFAVTSALAVASAVSPVSSAAETTEFKFTQASVSLGDDLALNYYVTAPEGYSLVGEFSYKGETSVAEATVSGDETVFRFDGITPQNMGEKVTLTVTATEGGSEVGEISYAYSVKEYCEAQLAAEGASDRLKTLVVDLLNYGAEAQKDQSYRTDALVNAKVDQTFATVFNESEPQNNFGYGAQLNGSNQPTNDVRWAGARLYFDSYIGIEYAFLAQNQSAAWLAVTVSDGTKETKCAVSELTENAPEKPEGYENWTWFSARYEGIKATEFNTVFEAYICNNEGAKWQDMPVLKYSVNSYIARHCDETENALERALFVYGKSAVGYANASEIKGGLVETPTYTETGKWSGATYGGYVYSEETVLPTLASGEYNVSVQGAALNGETLTDGTATFTLKTDGNVTFDVAVDHLVQIDGTAYSVYNLPDVASYDYASDTVTLSLDGVNYTKGILVWNKSLTVALAGENTVSGIAYKVNNTHRVESAGADKAEVLAYAIAVKANGNVTFTGNGTLNVVGTGVRTYANTVVNGGATINVTVDKRNESYVGDGKGEINDLYSEGFKVNGELAVDSATVAVAAASENVTSDMDKSGFVFAKLTVKGASTLTADHFAIGAYMEGAVTVENGATFNSLNNTRFALAGSHAVEIQSGATLIASVNAKVTNPVEKMNLLTIKKGATAEITTKTKGDETVTLTVANDTGYVTQNGAVNTARVINGGADNEANGFWMKEYNTYIYGNEQPNSTMALYVTYSSTGYTGVKDTTVNGYFVYTKNDTVQFLRFDFFIIYGWESHFVTDELGEGVTDEQVSNEFEVVYDGVRFRTSAWRGPMFGV